MNDLKVSPQLLSHKDLSPHEKLILIGIINTKCIIDDDQIQINLHQIESITGVENRTIRRSLSKFDELDILQLSLPEQKGRYRTLIPTEKYYELDCQSNEAVNDIVVDNESSSDDILNSIPTLDVEELEVSFEMISDNVSMHEQFIEDLRSGKVKGWIPSKVSIGDNLYKMLLAEVLDDEGSIKYVRYESIEEKLTNQD